MDIRAIGFRFPGGEKGQMSLFSTQHANWLHSPPSLLTNGHRQHCQKTSQNMFYRSIYWNILGLIWKATHNIADPNGRAV